MLLLQWINVKYKIIPSRGERTRRRRLGLNQNDNDEIVVLDGVSGQVRSGQMLAIMGSSGSGKTSILNILAARLNERDKSIRLSGEILVNGEKRKDPGWRQQTSYLAQSELFYEHLTVSENVHYSSKFRRNPSLHTLRSCDQLSEEAIYSVGLERKSQQRVGESLSGGERKRVALAMEIAAAQARQPQEIWDHVFFLDEPTSGLDSSTSQAIVESLKRLCLDKGALVILTIHQPRFSILRLFDRVMLMTKGKTVFFGEVNAALHYFELRGFPCPELMNPADHFIDVLTTDIRSEETRQVSNERINDFIENWELFVNERQQEIGLNMPIEYLEENAEEEEEEAAINEANVIVNGETNSRLLEFLILSTRSWKEVIRYRQRLVSFALQILILSILLGLVFLQVPKSGPGAIQNRAGILFFLVINVAFTTLGPLVNEFPLEKKLIRRETFAYAYGSSSAFLARAVTGLPVLLLGNIVYGTILYWMVGLQPSADRFFTYIAILVALVLNAQSYGLLVGAIAEDPNTAQIIGPTGLIIFLIFGGNFVNASTIPSYLVWIYWISPIHYGYAALFRNEFQGQTLANCVGDNGACNSFISGEQVIENYGFSQVGVWACFLILLGITLFLYVLGLIAFYFNTRPGKLAI